MILVKFPRDIDIENKWYSSGGELLVDRFLEGESADEQSSALPNEIFEGVNLKTPLKFFSSYKFHWLSDKLVVPQWHFPTDSIGR